MEEINIEEKENKTWDRWNIKWTKHTEHRSYWVWRPWQRTDTWKPRRKTWVKKWTRRLDKNTVDMKLWLIANYFTYWKKKIENPINISNWVIPWKLTMIEACLEAWISYSFISWLKRKIQRVKRNMKRIYEMTCWKQYRKSIK